MLILNLAGEVPERTLTTIARDLKEKIEGVSGVLAVSYTHLTLPTNREV